MYMAKIRVIASFVHVCDVLSEDLCGLWVWFQLEGNGIRASFSYICHKTTKIKKLKNEVSCMF